MQEIATIFIKIEKGSFVEIKKMMESYYSLEYVDVPPYFDEWVKGFSFSEDDGTIKNDSETKAYRINYDDFLYGLVEYVVINCSDTKFNGRYELYDDINGLDQHDFNVNNGIIKWKNIEDQKRGNADIKPLKKIVSKTEAESENSDWILEEKKGTYIISGYIGEDDKITIPNAIDGIPVTGIGKRAFSPVGKKKEEVKAIERLKEIVISDSVKNIGAECFLGNEAVECIKLSDNITKIPDNAFSSCINLKSVELPKKTKTFGEACFYNCKRLETIEIPKGVVSMGEEGSKEIDGCDSLINIVFPFGLRKFGGMNSASISKIEFNDSIECIGVLDCPSLEKIIVPDKYIEFKRGNFEHTKWYQEMTYDRNNPDTLLIYLGRNLVGYKGQQETPNGLFTYYEDINQKYEDINIKDGTISIADYLFNGVNNIVKLHIPASVEHIGRYAFVDSQITICAPKDSYAKEYAISHKLRFFEE